MLTQDAFFGGAQFLSISANKTLSFAIGKVCCVDATVGSLNVKLPSARQLRTGGYQGVVINCGSNSFALQDNGGTTLKTMVPGDAVELYCTDNLTSAGLWIYRSGVAGSSPEPIVDYYGYIFGASSVDAERDDTREYRSQTDVWSLKTELPDYTFTDLDIEDGACCVIGAKGYLVGFSAVSPAGYKKVLLQYDPDVWTRKTDSPNDFDNCGGDSIDDIEGYFFNNNGGDQYGYKYVAGTDAWTQGTERTTNHAGSFVGLAVGSKIVLEFGQQVSSLDFDYVDTFVWDTYTSKTNRPGLRRNRTLSTVLNGYLWSHGGQSSSSPPGLVRSSVQKYYEPTDTWSDTSDFVHIVCNGTCFTADGKMYLCGGNYVWSAGTYGFNVYDSTHSHVDSTDTYVAVSNFVGTNVTGAMALGRGITP
ncbi:kelch protein genomics consortium [Caudoviricetes sp.]|nr:kelch protein genomics consortium [Caudoviricetes sp.]UOF82785.1 kelch protein genomics consortium [Caudoviricetes sp.]